MSELRPCPFCDDDIPDKHNGGPSSEPWVVCCRTTYCGAIIRAKTDAEVVEAWNRRYVPLRHRPEREKLLMAVVSAARRVIDSPRCWRDLVDPIFDLDALDAVKEKP